jgi:hypothetical protein
LYELEDESPVMSWLEFGITVVEPSALKIVRPLQKRVTVVGVEVYVNPLLSELGVLPFARI